MIKPNLTHLAFDDRTLFYVGVLTLTAIFPLLFWGIDLRTVLDNGIIEYIENLTYTVIYWILCRQLIIELRKRYNSFEDTRKRFLIQALIVIPVVPIIGFLIGEIHKLLYGLFNMVDQCEPSAVQTTLSTYFLVFTCFLLYDTIYFIHKYREAIMEKNQLQLAHVQGQLENLKNQINPHFLFNSLNTLMNLIPIDAERAMVYLDKLSKFYRYAVSNQKQTLTPLKSELEIAVIYAELLNERFQDAITIELPTTTNSVAQIPPLSLQLLIENAVKHNIVSHKRPLNICVEIEEEAQYIWVRNNIQKKIQEVSSTGMGLKNIKKRFSFFTDHPVKVEEAEKNFSVGLPFIFADSNTIQKGTKV